MSDNEYDDEEGEEFPWAEIPSSTKGLRACKRCSLVKGNDQVKACSATAVGIEIRPSDEEFPLFRRACACVVLSVFGDNPTLHLFSSM